MNVWQGGHQRQRVLSVQSHVVHGYVGNKSAIFPLQLLGFEVDYINTVQFSNHTGYPRFSGKVLDGSGIKELADGLESNGLLSYSHLLTGYIGSKANLQCIKELILRLRQSNDVVYVCDPVLGDNGCLYVPEELVLHYWEEIVPLCTILTPNQFEAELLTGVQITDIPSALDSCRVMHEKGVETIVITSFDLDPEYLHMLLSTTRKGHGSGKWLVKLPRIPTESPFVGSGDLTAALLLAWTHEHPHELALALEKTAATMQMVLTETMRMEKVQSYESGKLVAPELCIIHCKKAIEEPQVLHWATEASSSQFLAMIFDLDGNCDHAHELAVNASDTVDARRILDTLGNSILARLKKGGMKLMLRTRNLDSGLRRLIDDNILDTILSAESTLDFSATGIPANQILFVCDSSEAVTCGRNAGCYTCKIGDPAGHDQADYVLSCLSGIVRFC